MAEPVIARPRFGRFLILIGQLCALLAVFWAYHIEGPVFFSLAALCFAGFAIHYWLPAAWKERFFIVLSVCTAFVVLDPMVAVLVLGAGVAIFGITWLPLSWGGRAACALAVTAALIALRYAPTEIPAAFWPTFGALFMFRLIIYFYELKYSTRPFGLREFAAYFFMAPNFYFLFFPVVDFQTMRKSFMRRDIHEVAQQGIAWMVRGTLQLLVYRVVVYLRGSANPADVVSVPLLVQNMILTYLLYLRVSGSFHIIVGFLHLFGYDLPETHRKWLLARSLTDFWRRINIYWKDFMVRIVYLPVYFRLRKSGDTRAQVIGTIVVFVVTWLAHAWQYWWMSGKWLLTAPDMLFWGTLGALVAVSVYVEIKRGRGRKARGPAVTVLQTAATFSLIVVLWSLWSSPSVGAWLELLAYRN